MKIIYLYDGTPVIIQKEDDYPNESWTETPPPEGIYQPYYFDGNQWIGTSKEDWEAMQNNQDEPTPPSELEELKQRIEELENKVKELTQGTD